MSSYVSFQTLWIGGILMGKMTIWKVKCLARVVDTIVIETVVRPVQNSIQQRKMFSDEIFIILDSIKLIL